MDINSQLTQHESLRCSICKNYLNVPPVLTSEDGKTNKCGRCHLKGPQLTNRNSLYEAVGAKLSFPCIYKECKERLAWADVERHEKSCKYRKIICPFWTCREKDIVMNLVNDTSHFETEHPGTLCFENIVFTLADIKRLQSFMKLLIIRDSPHLVIIHTVGTGERIWIGVFSFDRKYQEYQIKLYADKEEKKCVTYKEKIRLYDESRHCLYCLQNLCTIETHRYSRLYEEKKKEKFNFYTKVDVLCTKNVLVSDDMTFEISAVYTKKIEEYDDA